MSILIGKILTVVSLLSIKVDAQTGTLNYCNGLISVSNLQYTFSPGPRPDGTYSIGTIVTFSCSTGVLQGSRSADCNGGAWRASGGAPTCSVTSPANPPPVIPPVAPGGLGCRAPNLNTFVTYTPSSAARPDGTYAQNTLITLSCSRGTLQGPRTSTCNNGIWGFRGSLPSCAATSPANPRPVIPVPVAPVAPVPQVAVGCLGGCRRPNTICATVLNRPACVCPNDYIDIRGICRPRNQLTPATGRCSGTCPRFSQCSLFNRGLLCACNRGYLGDQARQCIRIGPAVTLPPVSPPATTCTRLCPRPLQSCAILSDRQECICAVGYIKVRETCVSRTSVAYTPARCRGGCTPNSRCGQIIGTNRINVCLCDPGYVVYGGTRCVPRPAPVVTCRRPTEASFRVTIPSRTQQTWVVGSTITYGCQPNYILQGSRQATCGTDGRFSNPPPRCIVPPTPRTTVPRTTTTPTIDYCVLPSGFRAPENGGLQVPNKVVYRFGDFINITCNTNYQLTGQLAQCQRTTRFSASTARCIRITRQCLWNNPRSVANGDVLPTARMVYNVNEEPEYTCDPGYSKAPVVCLSNGLFSGSPACTRVVTRGDCIIPIAPTNGDFNPKNSFWSRGNTVTYSCNRGYALVGTATATCRQDGSWTSEPPLCPDAPRCSKPYVPPGSSIKPNQPLWYLGDTVTYSCDSGLRLDGTATLRCVRDSQGGARYSAPVPSCGLPIRNTPAPPAPPVAPVATFCVWNPRFIQNGRPLVLTRTAYAVDTEPDYECSDGYRKKRVVCLNTGSFSASPECLPTTSTTACTNRPNPPVNGRVVTNGLTSWSPGQRVTFQCNNRLILIGNVSTICQSDGTFASTTTLCIDIAPTPSPSPITTYCNRLSAPANGAILGIPNKQRWSIGENLLFNCNSGYNLRGNEYVTCQSSGLFNGVVPTCEFEELIEESITCEITVALMLTTVVDRQPSYNVGDKITFQCPIGFQLLGSSQATCLQTGQFSGFPTCQPVVSTVRCPVVAPRNGSVLGGVTSVNAGATVEFNCASSFTLLGQKTIICGDNGQLRGDPPVCTECVPPLPQNGFTIPVNKKVWIAPDLIQYSCNQGYSLQGFGTNLCEPGGVIVGQTPTCVLSSGSG